MAPAGALLLILAAADDLCRDCHPAQTRAFRASPMGRSFGSTPAQGSAQFRHMLSGTEAAVRSAEHRLTRAGLTATQTAAYQIGSGSHARGFLIRLGRDLFQSPIAEYPRDRRWDLAPGYESMTHPDFNRAVTAECLLCHTNGATTEQPEAIGCQRCHGPAEAHLSKPAKGTIVNPARLPEPERDAVCEQCHLAGEARIPQPGRSFASYQPGQKLEDHVSVYVFDRPRADLRVISHVEQLARSRCAPKLSCSTCHTPHGEPIRVNDRCQSCHASPRAAGHPDGADCASCHMPKRRTSDGAHTAFTDHRIARRPQTAAAGRDRFALKPWRRAEAPALEQRNQGLAAIAVGERDRSPALMQEGYRQLRAVFPQFERDPAVLASLGMVLFLKDQHQDAAKLLRAALAVQPDAATYEKLAAVYRAAGDRDRAVAALESAITLAPSRETAYHLLHEIRPELGALQRFLRFNPQSLLAREAIRRMAPR